MADTTAKNPKTDAKAAPAVREFSYNGATLEDPDPAMSEKEAQAYFAQLYPEITNATLSIENKPATGDEPARKIVSFRKNVGTKG